jgi:hypothetical protein
MYDDEGTGLSFAEPEPLLVRVPLDLQSFTGLQSISAHVVGIFYAFHRLDTCLRHSFLPSISSLHHIVTDTQNDSGGVTLCSSFVRVEIFRPFVKMSDSGASSCGEWTGSMFHMPSAGVSKSVILL